MYVQTRIERRFNLRDREKAIEAFTATWREEIDLEQLREGFLTVIQRTMQPYSVSFWVRIPHDEPAQSGSMEEIMVAEDDPLMTYLLCHPDTLEIDHLHLDSPILQELTLHEVDSILPLASQGELLGLLILGPQMKGEAYTREERAMLDTLPKASHLPKDVPALPGWQLIPYYQPAREVGGDFYDFLTFADGRLGIVIGDVSGKGIPAALVMATVHTMLRTAVQGMSVPGEILARVNNLLAAEIPAGMFVTCFFALLDPKSRRLCYANAGHEPPFRRHDGSATELWATGMLW